MTTTKPVKESATPPPSTGTSSTLYLTTDLIPKFTGQDKTYPVSRWIQDVEEYGEICGWTPLQRLLMARRSLSGTAQLWMQAERPHKTWEELKTALSKEFPDTVDVKAIHELMTSTSSGTGSGERVKKQAMFGHSDEGETSYSTMPVKGECDSQEVSKRQIEYDIYDVNKQSQPEKPLKIVELCGKEASALIDSGSDVNLVSSEFCAHIPKAVNNTITLTGLGLAKVESVGCITTDVIIDDTNYENVLFYVVPKDCMPFDVIIGHEFLKDVITIMKGCDVWMRPVEWLQC
uniref:Peptidase A2 domain-containing protein n=1 Tax=Heliothis virescens TaxID=7102 RepID=A0A2A4JBX9_HELVI